MICPLCERDVPENLMSDHHLIPKSRGGSQNDTIPICNDCHNAIHAFFTNKELEGLYNTVESLLADEKFLKHVKWLKKQEPSKSNKSKRVKNKKYRGRSG